MEIRSSLHSFNFGPHTARVYVPDDMEIRKEYERQKDENIHVSFPYWSQIWPAAIALCQFIVAHPVYVKDRRVMELAAGLGLPSIVSSSYASKVFSSDRIPEAVWLMQLSADENKLTNMTCSLLDWTQFPEKIEMDVLLLSDINYNESDFTFLYELLIRLLQAGITILLSTPQRLMARPFIDSLLPYCVKREEIFAENKDKNVLVTVLVLNRKLQA